MGCLTAIQASAAQQLPAPAISVEAVMEQLQDKQDLVFVDVRESQAFEQVRIPGSLNIPLFAVKTKAFLKGKTLVLVDEGYRPRQLAEACEQLRQAGFDARFLFGGLNAWHIWSAKFILLPLQGDIFTQKTLNRMPPRALFAEQEGKYWLVINVSASGEAQSLPGGELHPPGPPQGGNVQPQTLSVPFNRDHPKQFLADIEHAVAHAPTRSEWFLIVIANQHGEDYEAIERVLQNTRIAPVFFLEGGFKAYRQFVAQQTQIRQGQPQDITTSCQPCAR
jgi:rhodanese-related sulfurtransferase